MGNMTMPDGVVSTDWLMAHLADPRVRIVDIRGYVRTTDLGGGKQRAAYVGAADEYEAAHIPGAVFVDWTSDITDPDAAVPAQLAPPERFAAAMSSRGIGDDTLVIAVDHTGGHFATRLWWALRAYGHDAVAILDGGYAAWTAQLRPLSDEVPEYAAQQFTPTPRPDLIVDADAVLERLHTDAIRIVDARDPGQYDGSVVRGSRGGHIPGAVNIPAKALVNADGTQKPIADQAAILAAGGVSPNQPVVAYCNGGVTATAVLLALHRTGHTAYANYDGSWNEWGERDDLPVAGASAT